MPVEGTLPVPPVAPMAPAVPAAPAAAAPALSLTGKGHSSTIELIWSEGFAHGQIVLSPSRQREIAKRIFLQVRLSSYCLYRCGWVVVVAARA